MEHILIENNFCDITYKSELTPTPIAQLAFAKLQLVWGLIRANNLLALRARKLCAH